MTGANYTTTAMRSASTGAGVTVNSGSNAFNVTSPASTTNNSADLTIGNLTRTTGAATIFETTAGTLGSSLPGSPQIFVNNVNGGVPTFTGNILGGWATDRQHGRH